jgi:hypothetical protein
VLRIVVVGFAVVAAVALGRAGAATTGCKAAVHTVGGATVRTFCGSAKATARIGGTTFRFSGGSCAVEGGYFTVNIGSITLPPAKPKFAYFGMDVKPPKAGAHPNQIVSWQEPGKRYSLLPVSVTVKPGLKGGTFTGKVLGGTGTGSGSFSCS